MRGVENARPDVLLDAVDREIARARDRESLGQVGRRDPELRFGAARDHVIMVARADVGVEAEADAARGAEAREALELAQGIDADVDAFAHDRAQLVVVDVVPVVGDPVGGKPARFAASTSPSETASAPMPSSGLPRGSRGWSSP